MQVHTGIGQGLEVFRREDVVDAFGRVVDESVAVLVDDGRRAADRRRQRRFLVAAGRDEQQQGEQQGDSGAHHSASSVIVSPATITRRAAPRQQKGLGSFAASQKDSRPELTLAAHRIIKKDLSERRRGISCEGNR